MPGDSMAKFWQEQADHPQVFDEHRLQELRRVFSIAERVVVLNEGGCYALTETGRVFTCQVTPKERSGRVRELNPQKTKHDRVYVRLRNRVRHQISRLLASHFLPPPLPGQIEVRHLDGNPLNNALNNLAWGTHLENMKDMVDHGRSNRGERSPVAKLNDNLVRAIRLLDGEGICRGRIATFLAVDHETVRKACSGEQWGHVDV